MRSIAGNITQLLPAVSQSHQIPLSYLNTCAILTLFSDI